VKLLPPQVPALISVEFLKNCMASGVILVHAWPSVAEPLLGSVLPCSKQTFRTEQCSAELKYYQLEAKRTTFMSPDMGSASLDSVVLVDVYTHTFLKQNINKQVKPWCKPNTRATLCELDSLVLDLVIK
uniref:Uncharacterized protein n=1 Tax=Pavo cristatus TaxID=9049 RepID=A0A8C9G0T2_PAVCR